MNKYTAYLIYPIKFKPDGTNTWIKYPANTKIVVDLEYQVAYIGPYVTTINRIDYGLVN